MKTFNLATFLYAPTFLEYQFAIKAMMQTTSPWKNIVIIVNHTTNKLYVTVTELSSNQWSDHVARYFAAFLLVKCL